MIVKFELKIKERGVATSILAISIMCALVSITIAYAATGGTLKWAPDHTGPPPPGTFQVVEKKLELLPEDLPIWLMVCDIPLEFFEGATGDVLVQYWVANEEPGDRPNVMISYGECLGPFMWPLEGSEYEICDTYIVHYRLLIPHKGGYKPGKDWNAEGILDDKRFTAHVHVIPEFAFGTAMSLLSLLSGLGLFAKYRKK